MTASDTPDIPRPDNLQPDNARPDTAAASPDSPAPDTDPDTTAGGGSDWPASPFACVDTAFAVLTVDPDPLTLDLGPLAGQLDLPVGPTPLPVLRCWLREHPTAWAARDAVWRELIRRARLDGPAWVVAATAFALPALVTAAARLTARGWVGDPDDVDAEVLAGFLTALRDRVDLARPAPYAGLCKAAWRAGLALVRQQRDFVAVEDIDRTAAMSRVPTTPWGHPDLLVRRAVRLGLLDACDEQPYIDVRLGQRALEPIAARLGVGVDTLRRRLSRIDVRLAAALADGLLTGTPSPQARAELAAHAVHRARTRRGLACTTPATA